MHSSRISLLLTLLFFSNTQACFHDHFAKRFDHNTVIVARDTTPPTYKTTAIINVRLFQAHSDHLSSPCTILLNVKGKGKITLPNPKKPLPKVDLVIDGTNKTVLPGLIDAHCHPHSPGDLLQLARAGVTTAINMACPSYPLCHSLHSLPGVADFISAGFPAQGFNSTHARTQGTPANMTINDPANADAFVQYVFGNGSDFMKTTAEEDGPSTAVHVALVAATHKRGKQAMTHASTFFSYQQAIAAKTDGIQHSPFDNTLTNLNIRKIRRQGQYVTPTFSIARALMEANATGNPIPPSLVGALATLNYSAAVDTMQRLRLAGVPIIAGTDATPSPDANSTTANAAPALDNPLGEGLIRELGYLAEAGWSPTEAIRAATILSSKTHLLRDRGMLVDGKRADVILVDGDAWTKNVTALHGSVERVWVAGVEVDMGKA